MPQLPPTGINPEPVASAPSLSPVRTRSRAMLPAVLPAPPEPVLTVAAHVQKPSNPVSPYATVGVPGRSDVIRPDRVKLPAPVSYDDNASPEGRALIEEQETTRIETLVLKGVRDASTIAKLLGLSRALVDKRLRKVYARWEVLGGGNVMKRARGEAISRTARLVLKLEEIIQDSKDNRERIVALKELHTLGCYLDTLRGLTPDAIAKLNMVAETNPVAARALKSDRELSLISDLITRMKAKARGDIEETGKPVSEDGEEIEATSIEELAKRYA